MRFTKQEICNAVHVDRSESKYSTVNQSYCYTILFCFFLIIRFYGRPPAILAVGHSALPLSFRSFFFSPTNLRGRLPIVTNFATCSMVTSFIKFGQKFPLKFVRPKTSKSARFRATSRLYREYLRNTTRHRQSENGVANSTDAPSTGKLNFVYFQLLLSTNGEKCVRSSDLPNGRPSSWAVPRI